MPKEDYKECQGEAGRENSSTAAWGLTLCVAPQSSLKPPGF